MMKPRQFYKAALLSASALAVCTVFTPSKTLAQGCERGARNNYYAGQAVGGQSIQVDLCSISDGGEETVYFVYYLGQERIQSQANCEAGTWTTLPEREVHRPQSQATQNMLNAVCRGNNNPTPRVRTATVFDPPSNVRTSPNGGILCTIGERTTINIYGSTGEWYYTDACGERGVIHSGQIRF